MVPGEFQTEGRFSVSTEQRENLEAILRQSAFPAGSDVNEQRRQLRELLSAQPLPADVTVTAAALGGVPTAEITVDGIEPRHVVLYFHGTPDCWNPHHSCARAQAGVAPTPNLELSANLSEALMDQSNCHRTLADGSCAALDRPAANIATGEQPRQICLER